MILRPHARFARFFAFLFLLWNALLPHTGYAEDHPETEPIRKPLGTAVHHVAEDWKGLFSPWPVIILVTGIGATAALANYDDTLQSPFEKRRYLGSFDTAAKWAAQPYVLDPLALAVWGFGKLSKNESVALTGETLFESLILTDVAVGGLKLAFRRERPNGGSLSFPSGHSAGTFAIATSLELLYGPKAGVPAFLAAGAIAFSRVDINAHHVSDVAMGAALGSAIAWATTRFHQSEHRRFTLAPQVGPDQPVGLMANVAF